MTQKFITPKFGLIGEGAISSKHKYAIHACGGSLDRIYDPKYKGLTLVPYFFKDLDYVVICSPSDLHREHIEMALEHNTKVIVEKPMVLPWEPMINDDKINIVLQYRWLNLTTRAKTVKVVMPRNEEYFKTWKGDPWKTGGIFYNLFIHYIMLAIDLKAKFTGIVIPKGEQVRKIGNFNLMEVDTNELYAKMYSDIVNHDKGVKPEDIWHLHWILNRCGWKFGFGRNLLNKKVELDFREGISL